MAVIHWPICYICGIPRDRVDVTAIGDPQPHRIPGAWSTPADDHTHAESPPAPPTPAELAAEGERALERVRQEWAR